LRIWRFGNSPARELANDIFRISSDGLFAKDYDLRNQIRRATGSVMDNIAEGFERGGRGEFIQFLAIAKGSAGEVRSQLYRAADRHYITPLLFDELRNKIARVSQMLSGLIYRLKQSDLQGWKYKPAPEATVKP
jgi:four helix bundle protein